MKAIILAAGLGSRLKDLTKNNPKCMLEVNGVTLIERALKGIDRLNLEEIILVLGYKKDILIKYINKLNLTTKVKFITNDIYDKTNNIYSLYLTKEEMKKNDILLIESDLIFEEKLIKRLITDNRKNLAIVDKYELWMDGTCVVLDKNENIIEFINSKKFDFNKKNEYYKTVNIYKFSKEFNERYYIPFLEAYINSNGTNQYYESVLETIINIAPKELKGFKVDNCKWYEIDDKQDLDIAESIFSEKSEKLEKFQQRYGGYWRYPKVLDFCYLVNPYFPPKKMMEEMKSNFEILLTQYPSGLKVNNLLASKYFNIKEDYVVVGNGAAELIKSIMEKINGNIGVVRPTFEEYPNRYNQEKIISFFPEKKGFKYSVEDLINFFDSKNIEILILINPDNPSGNYISKNEIEKLIVWAEEKNIKLLIDESFGDFAIEEEISLLKNDILEKSKNLIVVKSISKSYGVPGIRLGVIATGNKELINYIKKDVSIWNINSFGEYYMQIYGKYEKEYKKSLEKIKVSRKIFIEKLREIKELEVYDSEANYIMAKILNKFTSKELTEILLDRYNILIKDLKGKKAINDNYVRIAVRSVEDNEKCLEALKSIFKGE